MIEVVWEFVVVKGREAEFESVYNSEGEWAQLFRRDAAYQGTVLLRDRARLGRYLTIDRWDSIESYEKFKTVFAKPYAALDERCESLTAGEKLLGIFERVEGARGAGFTSG